MTADLFTPLPARRGTATPHAGVRISGQDVRAAAVDVHLAIAPHVDECSVALPPKAAPDLGAPAVVRLGGDAATSGVVVTGTVDAVATAADGTVEVRIVTAGARLAGLRVDVSYEQRSAADVLGDLCDRAGVQKGSLAPGPTYPFLVLHRGLTAWRHATRLGERQGHAAWVDEEGRVRLGPLSPGDVAASFAWGEDVLALRLDRRQPPAAPALVGEGAAGTNGADAWAWTVTDPQPVRAGDGPALRTDRSLRTPEAVRAAADAASKRAAAAATVVTLTVPLAPAVRPARGVTVRAVPGAGTLAGPVIAVRHEHGWRRGARRASTTTLRFLASGGAGGLPGGLL